MNISYSRFSSYLRCPYAHYLGYIENLKLNRPLRPLQFGGDFHKLLEMRGDKEKLKLARKEIEDTFYELPASWQNDLGENYLEDLNLIFGDYQRVYKKARLPDVTEQKFEIQIGKFKGESVNFVGIIDELYINDNNKISIGEHKTFTQKPDMTTLHMNTQKCLYAKAVYIQKGILPQEVIWDYIHSRPAKEPIWLEKSGRFSSAASKDITPYSWLRGCNRQNIEDEEIRKMCNNYKHNLSNFYFRVTQEFHPKMVDSIWDGFSYTCKDIARNGCKNKTKNITRDCHWCSYKEICNAEMTGGDREYVIKKDYIIKE